ncbi:MAG: 4Fe-4S binding protein [Propionibacteriaceae bacterium]
MSNTTSGARTPRTGPSRAQQRLRGMKRLKGSRRVVQLVFAAWIIIAAVRHQLPGEESASVDAICPFGAVETLITWITTGHFISKIHQSNIILGFAVLVATLLVGNVFCGWICPFGALQDALTWVRRKTKLPTLTVPAVWDRWLRWGRFVVLAVVIYFSVSTAKLWFSDYDPYVTLFGLGWFFEFNPSTMWISISILVLIVGGSLLVDRLWCRYLCPLGAVFAVLSFFSLVRIRRSPKVCTDCTMCDTPCPVGIEPSKAKPFASTDCIGCMDCVAACPVKGALRVEAPVLLGFPVLKEAERARRTREHVGAGSKDAS